MKDGLIAKAISELIDCKYSLGDTSKGYDCYNSLKKFYGGCGIDFPTKFRDWDILNYPDKWVYDPEIGRQTFFDFLMSLGKPIDKHYVLRGDLIILKAEVKEKPNATIRNILNKLKEVHPYMRKVINAVIEGKQLVTFPAIYLGNGHIYMIFDKGGKVMPYKFFKKFVHSVRRLDEKNQSQA